MKKDMTASTTTRSLGYSCSALILFLVTLWSSSVHCVPTGDRDARVRQEDSGTSDFWYGQAAAKDRLSKSESSSDEENAAFDLPAKRRRMPFRSDLGKRFLRVNPMYEEALGMEDPVGGIEFNEGEEKKRLKRYRIRNFKADLGKRFNLLERQLLQPENFQLEGIRSQEVRNEMEESGDVSKRRMFRNDLG